MLVLDFINSHLPRLDAIWESLTFVSALFHFLVLFLRVSVFSVGVLAGSVSYTVSVVFVRCAWDEECRSVFEAQP